MTVDINKAICESITKEWINPYLANGGTQVGFADNHNILESTVRKIKSSPNYRIPVETFFKICQERRINASEFFRQVEEIYPDLKIED